MEGQLIPALVGRHLAGRLAKEMGIEKFAGSEKWWSNFERRNGLKRANLCGEAGDVDMESLPDKIEKLRDVITKYPLDHIYNMDETGLFYRLLPKSTVILASEDPRHARGKKNSKNRVTFACCANASGTQKCPLYMLGKAKQPVCISPSLPWPPRFFYQGQRKAWMDRVRF